ncbi:hypothetical protein F511_24467 [Dorcoceras hygrometricum]|uniref:Uncharacterized protein n=1 Tax=Dorcoceras hygrometricum TaxID=472368 RepID=A0A2Z7CBV6_9LAMI|nr:hypothetical protein F511_24467 [Dorcoceras hygrometricum]
MPNQCARIRSTTGDGIPSSACTRRPDEIGVDGFSSSRLAGNNFPASDGGGGGVRLKKRGGGGYDARKSHSPKSSSHAQTIELSIRAGIWNPKITRWFYYCKPSTEFAKTKRCRINLFKRHLFAIANFEYARLVALKLATDCSSCTTSLYLLLLFTSLAHQLHFQLVHIVPSGSIRSNWFNTFLLVILAPWCTSRFIIPFDVPAGPPSTLALAAGSYRSS